MSNPKPDWRAMFQEYMEGAISLREIAVKYDVPFSTVSKRAYREQWATQREEFGIAVKTRVESAALEVAATRGKTLAERSVALREGITAELEKDLKAVAATAPTDLQTASIRQAVVGQIVRSAAPTLRWDDERTTPCLVRINVLGSAKVALPEELKSLAQSQLPSSPLSIDVQSAISTPAPKEDHE